MDLKKKQLKDMSTKELGMLFPISISEPNPKWPLIYDEEKSNIEKFIGKDNIVCIEHIGSTSVPNLKAKPCIDILLEIKEDADKNHIIDKLNQSGYQYIPQPENPPPHMMFAKGYTLEGFKGQAFHIHVRYQGDWDEKYFRDYLILHPETANKYVRLKEQMAVIHKYDRDAYTNSKTEFIKRITELARKTK